MSTVLQTDTFNENVRITLTLSFTGSLWRACRDISSMIQANGVLVRSHLTSCLLACGDGRLCREGVKRKKFCLKRCRMGYIDVITDPQLPFTVCMT
jgi:hypothetical protein